jgi:hypothetical protein
MGTATTLRQLEQRLLDRHRPGAEVPLRDAGIEIESGSATSRRCVQARYLDRALLGAVAAAASRPMD